MLYQSTPFLKESNHVLLLLKTAFFDFSSNQNLNFRNRENIFVEIDVWPRDKCINNVKGKAIPLQALAGPEGSRRLRLLDFKTHGT
jgi:hypothetical protein